jgi:hypothetical protein
MRGCSLWRLCASHGRCAIPLHRKHQRNAHIDVFHNPALIFLYDKVTPNSTDRTAALAKCLVTGSGRWGASIRELVFEVEDYAAYTAVTFIDASQMILLHATQLQVLCMREPISPANSHLALAQTIAHSSLTPLDIFLGE